MPIQHILNPLFILVLLIPNLGCKKKSTDAKPFATSQIQNVKTPKKIIKEWEAESNPAVIYRSNDIGKTWAPFQMGIPSDATLSGIKQHNNKIYVTTDYHGVFVSIDGHDNWTALNGGKLKGLDNNCIEVDGDNILIGTLKKGTFISKDGGVTWNSSKANIKSPIRAFIKTRNKIYAGTDAGIFESVDMGNTWVHVFGQMQILGFTSLKEKIYAAAQNGALMCSGDATSWKSIYQGDALHDIGNDGIYIYAMTIGQQLLKTQNDGELWENAQNGITYPQNFYTNELQHIGINIFSAQWIGIYQSDNNGNSWRKLKGLPDSTAFSTLEITDYGIIAGISIR